MTWWEKEQRNKHNRSFTNPPTYSHSVKTSNCLRIVFCLTRNSLPKKFAGGRRRNFPLPSKSPELAGHCTEQLPGSLTVSRRCHTKESENLEESTQNNVNVVILRCLWLWTIQSRGSRLVHSWGKCRAAEALWKENLKPSHTEKKKKRKSSRPIIGLASSRNAG